MADDQLAAALLQLADTLEQLLEAVDGYRQLCISHGYPPKVAEQMALQYHGQLIPLPFQGLKS